MDAISFGTDGWRATLDLFTDDRVRAVGQAVADYLDSEGTGGPVVVGYDARESSEGFAESLAAVLADNGRDVVLPHRDCPTPVVARAVCDRDAAGALVVTASHNPPEYNGVKFIPEDGAPALPAVTDAIEARLAPPRDDPVADRGVVERADLVGAHADAARDLVGRFAGAPVDLSGLTVAYDAMHGSGRGVTDALLADAGADVRRLRCDRDPTFGGTPPEPAAGTLGALAEAVDSGPADLGIANDGDADRIAVVTPDRGVVDPNLLFGAAYDYLLEAASGPAVRTVSTSFLLDRIAEAHGETAVETAVGFKWVAAAMADHGALIGGEESGGFGIRGHVREKDGVAMGLLVAAAAREEPVDARLDRLRDSFGEIHADKRNLDCPDGAKADALAGVEAAAPSSLAGREVAEVVTVDGVKFLLADGAWLLVRPSGTEPKMRIYAEADAPSSTEAVLDAGVALVSPHLPG